MNKFIIKKLSRVIFNQAVLTVILVLAVFSSAQAQFQVIRVYGSDCVGATNVFVFTGSNCAPVTWYVYGGGTVISQSSNSVQVRWNSPTSMAYVVASYYGCPNYPYSGSVSSPTYYITNPVM